MSLGFIGTVITGAIISTEHQYLAGVTMVVYSMLALRYRVDVSLVMVVMNALLWLKYAVGLGDGNNGPVICVSPETGLFSYVALTVPIIVGVLVVGSFERRIVLWLKKKKAKNQ
jgi:hypothetical protein